MYNANVYTVFIASPSDVQSERNLVIQRIHNWNSVHSETRSIVLMPLTYELNTPSRFNNPQETIDEYVLIKADFLVGIFWSIVGSGATEHEIIKHVDSGKPAALFFSQRDVPYQQTDGVTRVKELQNHYKTKAFYHQYQDDSGFINHIDNELNRFVNEITSNNSPIIKSAELDEWIDEDESEELSQHSKDILLAMNRSKKPIRVQDFMHTFQVDTGLESLYYGPDPREFENWNDAINQLYHSSLLQVHLSLSHGTSYTLTKKGWAAVDELNVILSKI